MAGKAARRKLIVVSVVSAALATTAGAAFAADSGTAATSPAAATSGGQIVVAVAKSGAKSATPQDKANINIAAIARDLGVSVDRLNSALMATKEWLGTQADPNEAAFAAHVASILGLPSDRVLSVFEAHGLIIGAGPGDKGKPGGGRGGHDVDVAKIAADLKVSTTQLRDAISQTKEWLATSGTAWTPQALAGHIASLLGRPASLVLQVLERDGAIAPQ